MSVQGGHAGERSTGFARTSSRRPVGIDNIAVGLKHRAKCLVMEAIRPELACYSGNLHLCYALSAVV